jgi:oligopeptide transport system substrate-binding protein
MKLSFVAFLALFLTSFAQAKTLNARLVDPPVSLDWGGQASLAEAPIVLNLCEGLYTYDYATKKLIPGIAASLKKSTDLREYTFEIRKDAKWSDGRAIYAQDFVDAWVRLVSPQSTSIYSYYLFDVVNAREYNSKKITSADEIGIKAVGDRTLVVKLKRPSQNWEANTAFWPLFPVRKDLMEKFGTNWWRAGVLVSSGPFVFDSYEPGKKLVLKRNKYYKRYQSNVDQVNLMIISDHEASLKKYDEKFFPFISNLPFKMMADLSKRKDYHSIPIMRHHLIAFNAEKFPLNNQSFRLAVLSAIDTSILIPKDAIHLRVGKTLIPPPIIGSSKPTAVPFDIVKAKDFLKKSGVVLTATTKLRILTSIAEPFYSIGKNIQSQIQKNLGLTVDLAALPNQELTNYMNLSDYNAALMSWTAKVVSPQDFLLPYSGEALANRTHFTSPFYDQWIFEGAQASTPAMAEDSFYHAQKFISAEQGVLDPLFYESSSYLANPTIKKIYFDHMGTAIFKDVTLQ